MRVLTVSGVLAENVNNFGDTRGGALAGPLGLLIIALLSIATVLLIRNMNKRLRRLPQSFPQPGDAPSSQDEPVSGPPAGRPADGTTVRSADRTTVRPPDGTTVRSADGTTVRSADGAATDSGAPDGRGGTATT
jgi:hypothetical protein